MPAQIDEFLINTVNEKWFYILCPDDDVTTEMYRKRVEWAASDITENRPPLSGWHPDFKDIAAKECN